MEFHLELESLLDKFSTNIYKTEILKSCNNHKFFNNNLLYKLKLVSTFQFRKIAISVGTNRYGSEAKMKLIKDIMLCAEVQHNI